MARWLFAKQNQQNGALSVDIADDGCENDCKAQCCRCHLGIVVGGDRDLEDGNFLTDNIIDDDEFKLMLSTLLPLHPATQPRLSVLS